jgi:chromosome segregation ATPase
MRLRPQAADASVSQYLQTISDENLHWKGRLAEVSQQLRAAGGEVAGLQASNESCAAQLRQRNEETGQLQQRCACLAGAEAELSKKVASAEAELQTVRSDFATSQSARDRASVLSRCEVALKALREELQALKEDKARADEVAAASGGDLGNVLGQLQEKEEGRAAAAAQVRDLQRHLSELAVERDRLATACESAAREQHAARDRVGELQAERTGLLTRLAACESSGTMSQDERAKQEGRGRLCWGSCQQRRAVQRRWRRTEECSQRRYAKRGSGRRMCRQRRRSTQRRRWK